ncbi:uncharacterized protein BO87DRAFT_386981 [Aspergillus neoniger CBS 115656]|uniref:Uncharacterized protein n=1 Tax=Aspergillus neoniger (strain CBS 115656) TaxID=1448310 RepID=A0A318YPL4_ASPNB|nr:hypothetical protein BO87DRAFT_386981 [Aspergillus neoniger CBS 115656]PYH34010.1 hypothetical protein BO87DRAFT_386981 [Aspergillus neoniger CBS 115656]
MYSIKTMDMSLTILANRTVHTVRMRWTRTVVSSMQTSSPLRWLPPFLPYCLSTNCSRRVISSPPSSWARTQRTPDQESMILNPETVPVVSLDYAEPTPSASSLLKADECTDPIIILTDEEAETVTNTNEEDDLELATAPGTEARSHAFVNSLCCDEFDPEIWALACYIFKIPPELGKNVRDKIPIQGFRPERHPYPYQVYASMWLLACEATSNQRGRFLADDIGFGKGVNYIFMEVFLLMNWCTEWQKIVDPTDPHIRQMVIVRGYGKSFSGIPTWEEWQHRYDKTQFYHKQAG